MHRRTVGRATPKGGEIKKERPYFKAGSFVDGFRRLMSGFDVVVIFEGVHVFISRKQDTSVHQKSIREASNRVFALAGRSLLSALTGKQHRNSADVVSKVRHNGRVFVERVAVFF